jgi:hypothetical protein
VPTLTPPPLPPLTLGTAIAPRASLHAITSDEPPPLELPQGLPNLALVVRRCNLKAQACELAAQLSLAPRASTEHYTLKGRSLEMVAQARQIEGCFLWQCIPDKDPGPSVALALIQDSYTALAQAAQATHEVWQSHADGRPAGDELTECVNLLAEAQSMLRVALKATWLVVPDRDQEDAFNWLRDVTSARRIYVDRFMRLDDPADPTLAQQVIDDATDLIQQRQARKRELDLAQRRFKTLEYHVKRIAEALDSGDAHDWNKVESQCQALVEKSEPDKPLRRRLRPILRKFQLDPAAAGPLTRANLEALLASPTADPASTDPASTDPDPQAGDADPAATAQPRAWSATVQRVARTLAGKRVVLIGGERRERQRLRIEQAFNLSELEWCSQPEHATSAPFQAPITRADTALVLILIKLTGHQHSEDVARWAKEAAKPLVRLPAGYNPERVASAIVEQVGQKLGLQQAPPPAEPSA